MTVLLSWTFDVGPPTISLNAPPRSSVVGLPTTGHPLGTGCYFSSETTMSSTPRAKPEAMPAAVAWTTAGWTRTLSGVLAMGSPVILLTVLAQPLIGVPLAAAVVALFITALRKRRLATAEVFLEADGIRVESSRHRRRIRRSAVASAFDDATSRNAVLHLANGASVELGIADPDARERVLTHLGQTLEQRALVAPLRGMLGAFTRGLLAFVGSYVGLTIAFGILGLMVPSLRSWSISLPPLIALATTMLVVKWIGNPRVIVGADGIRLTGRLLPKVIPYSRLASLEETAISAQGLHGISVTLDDASKVFLPTVAQSTGQIEALIRRIREGRRRYEQSERAPLENFERAGRTMKAWREDLVRLSRGGGFRTATIDPRAIESLAADPTAPIDRRVGAALALREVAPDAVARIRIAAERSVDDRVRIALEEAAAEHVDEDRLERALRAR
jgi:hypothetical protein